MIRGGSQSGESKAGCLLWSLVLILGAMVAIKVIPVQMSVMSLKDHINDIAERRPRSTKMQVIDSIYRRALELDLPVEKKHIEVKKSNQRLVADVKFTVPLDFPGYTHNWKIKIHVDRDIFII